MSNKRVLVVGSNGLLGQKITEFLVRGSAYHITTSSVESTPARSLNSAAYLPMDITSKKDVKHVIHEVEPDVIINCAAMTNVDACETERELAWKLNVEGVEHLIEASRRTDATIVHVSTDYVFDGKAGPYDESARPEPVSYYGKTKLASENALHMSGVKNVIARTMVLYGTGIGVKPNFALWLIQNLEQGLPVKIVDDQFGNPTLVDDLAQGILSAIELERVGTYHLAGRDIISRYDFALRLAQVFDFDPGLIVPIKTSQLRQPAARPMKSGLITLKAEVELGYRPSTAEQGLMILKSQLVRSSRKLPDSAPIPSAGRPPHGKR
jgi:dTDP-4-dehydrorhamnose reductase